MSSRSSERRESLAQEIADGGEQATRPKFGVFFAGCRGAGKRQNGAAGVQQQQQQEHRCFPCPMLLVEQLNQSIDSEHEDEDGEPRQRAREESSGSGRLGGQDDYGGRCLRSQLLVAVK